MRKPLKLLPICLLAWVLNAPAEAATFTIDALGDAGDANPGDGVCDSILAGVDCTLRAAVQEANALAGPDTILLPAMTIVLADVMGGPSADDDLAGVGDLDITESLSILGSPGSTVEGPEGVPVVQLHSGTLTLHELTLDGKSDIVNLIPGSTIGIETLAGTTLAASNSTIRGMVKALSLAGRSDLDEITIEENFDAVSAASGAVTSIERSTIRSNTCTTNLLVDNAGTLLFVRNTVRSNFCGQQIDLFPCPFGCVPGFAIRNSGVARIASSSILGNLLLGGGSAIVQVGAAITSLDSVTIRDFQSNTEPIEVRNSIVNCRNDGTPTLVSRGHNFDYSTGANCGFSEPSDLSSTSISWQSSPDGISDSPTTGSPTVDSGPAACATRDRLDNARPFGAGCDRGAVEVGAVAVACADGADNDGDGGIGSSSGVFRTTDMCVSDN